MGTRRRIRHDGLPIEAGTGNAFIVGRFVHVVVNRTWHAGITRGGLAIADGVERFVLVIVDGLNFARRTNGLFAVIGGLRAVDEHAFVGWTACASSRIAGPRGARFVGGAFRCGVASTGIRIRFAIEDASAAQA